MPPVPWPSELNSAEVISATFGAHRRALTGQLDVQRAWDAKEWSSILHKDGVSRYSRPLESLKKVSVGRSYESLSEELDHSPFRDLGHLSAFQSQAVLEDDGLLPSSDPSSDCKRLGVVVLPKDSSWLSSPLLGWGAAKSQVITEAPTPKPPTDLEVESWLGDFNSSDDVEAQDAFLECPLTFESHTNASEVEATTYSSFGLAITIPQRTSSLSATWNEDKIVNGRRSRMKYHEGSPNAPLFEQWIREEQRLSTLPLNYSSASNLDRQPVNFDMPTPPASAVLSSSVQKEDCISAWGMPNAPNCRIIQALEEFTRDFPSKILRADTPCIMAIRFHSRSMSPVRETASSRAGSKSERVPRRSLDRTYRRPSRSQAKSIIPFSKKAAQRFNSFGYSWDFQGNQAPSGRHAPDREEPASPVQAPPSPKPNFDALREIVPTASDYTLEALYAYVLGYRFVCSKIENGDTRPTSAHCAKVFQSVPSKAASTLGIPASTLVPRASTDGEWLTTNLPRLRQLRDDLAECIGQILHCDADCGVSEERVSIVLLRALVQIVKIVTSE